MGVNGAVHWKQLALHHLLHAAVLPRVPVLLPAGQPQRPPTAQELLCRLKCQALLSHDENMWAFLLGVLERWSAGEHWNATSNLGHLEPRRERIQPVLAWTPKLHHQA